MPLPEPSLDNRTFDQLVAEGQTLLVRRAPEWTDYNASDPGITLLELAAWLAEQNIYRLDRMSDDVRRAFVRLIGIELKPSGIARSVVAIENRNGVAVDLPPRVQLSASVPLFETTAGVVASPARLTQVAVGRHSLVDVTEANASSTSFLAFGPRSRAGHALYLGFDRALDTSGVTLTLHVWSAQWTQDDDIRLALQSEAATLAARRDRRCAPPPDWRTHYRVATVWEYFSRDGCWKPLRDVVDETRALTLTGFVRFAAPVDHGSADQARGYFIRCRIATGRFECPPRIARIAFNAVPCEHGLSRAERSIGRSRGHAAATFALGEAPIAAGSVALRLDGGAGNVQDDWSAVSEWDRAGAHDRAFRIDTERGEIQSGDGLRGAILPADHELMASWRSGGGVAGNVPAGTLTSISPTPENVALAPPLAGLASALAVAQPFDATGGSPPETLESAQARAFDAVMAVDKAVTLEDVERLARATPGVPVARVRAIANMEPALPCYGAPGVVTVVAIPYCPLPTPRPSQALLDAVARYLEPRRLTTCEIVMTGPRYRRIAVQATLHVARDADAQATVDAARARLDAFFDPLTGGPSGTGWPFGRTVYRSEILTLLATTAGVHYVTSVALRSGYGDSSFLACDNVELCAHELVASGRHVLRTETEVARDFERSEPHECESA